MRQNYISITSRASPDHNDTLTEYFINGLPISPCNWQKDLGILISSDLSWSHHISRITSKAYKILGLLRRMFASSNNVTTKKKLYLSLVRSQLIYGSLIWRPLLQRDINTIEHIQRRATKYILNRDTSDYRSRLIILNLLPLSMLLELSDICFFVKSFKLHESPDQSFTEYDPQTRLLQPESGIHYHPLIWVYLL